MENLFQILFTYRYWISNVTFGALFAIIAYPAYALPIYVAETQNYRYVNATPSTTISSVPSNWYTSGFDDSTWFVGNAPFSNTTPSSTILDLANVNEPYAPGAAPPVGSTFTQWDANFDPYLRTHFTLSAPTALTLWLAVDNGVNGIFLNGVQATASVNAEGNAFRWEHIFDIAPQYTFAGDNLLALQLEDHGVLTGFSLMITGDDPTTHPPLTTNPPPTDTVPEPATFTLVVSGLIGLCLAQRARASKRSPEIAKRDSGMNGST